MKKYIKKVLHLGLIISILSVMLLTGCGSSDDIKALDPTDYKDPPEDQWKEVLSIYIAWDGAGGEVWEYEMSEKGIVEECGPPAKPAAEEEEDLLTIDEGDDPPGGRSVYFRGLSPGDVVITFTTENDSGEVVDVQQYAIRVFDDLRLALLHEERTNLRD